MSYFVIVSVVALKLKWKNLRDTYKKHKHAKQSTNPQAAKTLRNWYWADHMSFTDSVTLDETQSYCFELISPKIESDDNPTNSTFNGEESIGDSESTQESGLQETENAQPEDRMIQYTPNKRRDSSNLNDVKCDGLDLLFLGYADTFKKLSKRKQVQVKFDISKILMEAELSDLDTEISESYSMGPGTSYSNAK